MESGEEKTQELYETEEGTATGSEVGDKQEVACGNKERNGNPKNENQHEVEVKTQVEMSHDASPVDQQTAHRCNEVDKHKHDSVQADEPSPAHDDVSTNQD